MASIRKRTQWRLVLEHSCRYKTYPTHKQAQADLEAYEAQGLMGLRIERAPGGSWEVRIRSKLAPDLVKSFERRAQADAWAKEREGEIAKRQFVDYREADRNTLGDLLERYDRERLKGRPKDDPDKVRVRKLREDPLAGVRMSVLQSSDIVKYRDARTQLVKGSTVRKELELVCRVIAIARAEWGVHLALNPASGRLVRRPEKQPGDERNRRLVTYADGPIGQQNIYVKASVDQGATWSAPLLLSRDAAGQPTGGQPIVTQNALAFVADNDKPSLFAAPVTSGPRVVVTWTSAYCPQDPAGAGASHAGTYTNPTQGASDQNADGSMDRPFYCVWTATTMDPALAQWNVTQLTDGQRDAIAEVVSGNATGTAYAIAWQEDPAGLQPGEAEGPGDGGSGAVVSPGTNIWYTHAASPDGTLLRANIAQVSDNNSRAVGQPGGSRANLQVSGSTAGLAYEETACPGGAGGRCIVYHAFPYAAHDTNSAGAIVSDVTKNSRRVRFALQGAASAGSSSLRTVVLWREAASVLPGAPSDIVLRRGLVDTTARPGSTGYLASDILADAPQNMTQVAASGGNANAHRAIVRGDFVALAYDLTPNMDAANPERTSPPTANYNLFITRSLGGGQAGSWSSAKNITRIASPLVNVVEPRLVPTPSTIINPLTGVADSGDTQDPNVLYLSYATESNDLTKVAGRAYVTRSTDQAASFEPFVPVSADVSGQSELQLRASPDGASVGVLWMGEQTQGDPLTKDAMFAAAAPIQLPELKLMAARATLQAGSPGVLSFSISNSGTGAARNLVLQGTVRPELVLSADGATAGCVVTADTFRCALSELPAGETREWTLPVSSSTVGSFEVAVDVTNEVPELDTLDNAATTTVVVRAEPNGGSGCTEHPAGTGPRTPRWRCWQDWACWAWGCGGFNDDRTDLAVTVIQPSFTHRSRAMLRRWLARSGRFSIWSIMLVVTLGFLSACGGDDPPGVPAGLTATAAGTEVTVNWDLALDASSHNLYWSTSPGVTTATGTKIEGVTRPYVHTGLTSGATYYYVLTAVNAEGESAASAEVSATLVPGAPGTVSATSADHTATVDWRNTLGATSYNLYWSNTAGVTKATGTKIENVTAPYAHTGLTNGTTYYYVITAVGAAGESVESEQVSAVPQVPLPEAPQNLSAVLTPETTKSVTLQWSKPSIPVDEADILSYTLYRSTSANVAANLAGAVKIEGVVSPHIDLVPAGQTTYYYVVVAVTGSGEGPASAEVSATPRGSPGTGGGGGGGGGGETGAFGNNLSVPLVFADGVGVLGGVITGTDYTDLATGLRPTATDVTDPFPYRSWPA